MDKPQPLLSIIDLQQLQRNVDRGQKHKIEKVEGTSSDIKIKKENDENDCRVCLKEGSIPIFGCEGEDNIPEALYTFGCINVSINDSYPKYLCETCYSMLQYAILFRKTAQETDEILNNPIVEENIEPDPLDLSESLGVSRSHPSAGSGVEPHKEPGTGDNYVDDSNLIKMEVKTEPEHICITCGMSFETLNELEDHLSSGKHENNKQVCQYCNKSYLPGYYKHHLKLHTDVKPYTCHICGRIFKTERHFNSHKLNHKRKPLKCSNCPYIARNKFVMKLHVRLHTGERPYECSECPARFISIDNLSKHSLTHKGSRSLDSNVVIAMEGLINNNLG